MRLSDQDTGVRAPGQFRRPWLRSRGPVPRRVVQPVERFLREEAGSGVLLLVAALAALVWSNVSTGSYDEFWSTEITVRIGSLAISDDLRHLVNDLLMAIFFYIVALEVKRELIFGSLRDRATAGVPVAAAVGTMVGGAVVYLVVNLGADGDPSGWAVPIATDIAFALGVLGIAGHRAPPALRAFLLTLAVVDDLGTIAVIAVFFSEDISLAWLAAAGGLLAAMALLRWLRVRLMVPYILLAGLVWLAVFESGVHATLAGVALGFLTPAFAFHPREETGEVIGAQLEEMVRDPDVEVGEGTMWEVSQLAREAVSPLARLEERLHPWSAYGVLPLFALANAGVAVSLSGLADALTGPIGLGIVLGLAVGAPLGGILVARALVAATPTRLPEGLDWPAIAGVAPLKGIGFTVAIFISVLAFESEAAQAEAKLAILAGSALSGAVGLAALLIRHRVLSARGTGPP